MLAAGQLMVRADDGVRGTVQLTAIPGFEGLEELRIVYFDRGEMRIAGKREVWEPERGPARKLRAEEIRNVAAFADHMLRCLDKNETAKWWEWGQRLEGPYHDPELVKLVVEHLQKRV
jgi:hypothetical protein